MDILGYRNSLCCVTEKMKFLSIQEVANTMRVSDKTVRRMIKRGDLTAYKVGERGQLRIKERDLEQYIEGQRVEVQGTVELSSEVTGSGE